MSAPSFIREVTPEGGSRLSYATPAGVYTLTQGQGGPWVLATLGGQVLGTYATVELAEAALDADVKNRMWS